MLSEFVIWFVVYSFGGWVFETVMCSIKQREFVKRGFLNGPYCPIYGIGAILYILILGQVENPLLLFLAGAAIAAVLEYFTGWLLETLFHARWWDYSDMRFNLNGRVSLWGMLAFGLFAIGLVKFAQPLLAQLTDLMTPATQLVVAIVLLILLVIDIAVTVAQITSFIQKLHQIQHFLTAAISESIEESQNQLEDYLERAKETMAAIKPSMPTIIKPDDALKLMVRKLTGPERRILKAFPQFSSTHYGEAVKRLREYLKNLRD